MGVLLLVFGMLAMAAIVTASMVVTAIGRRRAAQASVLWLLAIAVEKRLPLIDEIEAFAAGSQEALRVKMLRLAELVRDGLSLGDALAAVPGLVPPAAAMAVGVGERTGRMAEALREAAVRQTSSASMQFAGTSSLGYMLAYLCLLMLVMFQIVGFLMYWIVPKFRKIFEDFGVPLPHTTRLLIGVSDFVMQYFVLLLPLGLLLGAGAASLVGRVLFDWGRRDLPLLGRRLARLDTPGLLRGMARATEAGRPLTTAMQPFAEGHRRPQVRAKVRKALTAVEAGQEPWHALRMVGLLRPREAELLRAADHARNLPWALRTLSETIERRRLYRVLVAGEFLHPVVVLGFGLLTYIVALGFFLPLIALLQENTAEVTL